MKSFKIISVVLALTASSLAMAEGGSDRLHGRMIQANEEAMRAYATENGKNVPEVVHYRYGMKLDVAKVVSLTSTKGSCEVMPAQMTYEDSSGKLNILEYRVPGTNCRNQN